MNSNKLGWKTLNRLRKIITFSWLNMKVSSQSISCIWAREISLNNKDSSLGRESKWKKLTSWGKLQTRKGKRFRLLIKSRMKWTTRSKIWKRISYRSKENSLKLLRGWLCFKTINSLHSLNTSPNRQKSSSLRMNNLSKR